MCDPKHFPFDVLELLNKCLDDKLTSVATLSTEALFRLLEFDETVDKIPDEVKG